MKKVIIIDEPKSYNKNKMFNNTVKKRMDKEMSIIIIKSKLNDDYLKYCLKKEPPEANQVVLNR